MKKLRFLLPFLILACTGPTAMVQETEAPIMLPEIEVVPEEVVYNASHAKVHDLIHMKLEVSFDWTNQTVHGTAELELKPWFYPSDELKLDAKGMDILYVNLVTDSSKSPLSFTYDSLMLDIQLNKLYSRIEKYTIEVGYIANPNQADFNTGGAIANEKGLYFINPDSTEVNKPTQIWTQGQVQSNSVWFPTIDSPNERMTQEIYINVSDRFKTLSNGSLIYSNFNADGTRTDYWKQDQPHPPYLVMLAVGDWVIAMDQWYRKDGSEVMVNYYMEPEYANYAFRIFGNTPEMIQYYSDVLNYEFPWDKYAQVVVRDYVSGAMENTSAVIHGEFLNQNPREMVDMDFEEIIAHELFHHWFGDLVTCENWANLPLNESFATYGEYLWFEHKYGPDRADYHAYESMQGYFYEAQSSMKNLIRYGYSNPNDMFDAHSYNKGGAILHMLRHEVGDEAFFEALNLYLNNRAFNDAEIDHLRQAFEQVTGQDLHWFFNQWFLGAGHPKLDIKYFYNDSLEEQQVLIAQIQDADEYSIFQIPIDIDVYHDDQKNRHHFVMTEQEMLIKIPVSSPPSSVIVDADKVLLAQKTDHISVEWAKHQLKVGPKFLDRLEALKLIMAEDTLSHVDDLKQALSDPFWNIRYTALEDSIFKSDEGLKMLPALIKTDPSPQVQSAAISILANSSAGKDYVALYRSMLNHQAYSVVVASIDALAHFEKEEALQEAAKLELEQSNALMLQLAAIYADYGTVTQQQFFHEKYYAMSGYEQYALIYRYGEFCHGKEPKALKKARPLFEDMASNGGAWWMKISGYLGYVNIINDLNERIASINRELGIAERAQNKEAQKYLTEQKSELDEVLKIYTSSLNQLKEKETDARVLNELN